MIELKTADEIDKMAVTGEFVAETLATLLIEAEPGVNLMQLEHHARALITDRGAKSCYWDYAPSFGRGPFRASSHPHGAHTTRRETRSRYCRLKRDALAWSRGRITMVSRLTCDGRDATKPITSATSPATSGVTPL